MRMIGIALLLGVLAACSHEATQPPAALAPAMVAEQEASDPAVDYANELSGSGTPYSSSFSGEGDKRIHYVKAGQGPTVLFVHGFPSFWYVWRDQMEALRHCRRVIAIDAPGAGLSAKPTSNEAYEVENLAHRLDALIDELAPGEKVTLVGHDWGGALSWSYVQSDDSRVDKLAVFSAPSYNLLLDLLANDPEQRAASSYMPRLLAVDRQTAATDAFASSFFDLAYKQMLDTAVLDEREGALFRAALRRDGALYAGIQWYKANVPSFDRIDPPAHYWPKERSRVEVPVLLVRGETDRTFVKQMENEASVDAANLTVVTIDGVGHWTPFQNPKAAHSALSDFILRDDPSCGVPAD